MRVEVLVGPIDARRRRDTLEVGGGRACAPPPHRRERGVRIAGPQIEVERGVEHELRADQPARVVARGEVVVRAQVIGALVREPARAGDLEQSDLGPAARIAVADDGDRVPRDEHLVVPRAGGVDIRAKCFGRRHGLECAAGDVDGEEASPPQDDEVLAVQLDDSALVHARVLDIGDGLGLGRRRRGSRRCRCCGLAVEHSPGM